MRADVSVAADCEAQVAETVALFGRIDIAVNNAGVAMHKLALDMTPEEWERVLRINLTGSFLTAQAAARLAWWTSGWRADHPDRLDLGPARQYGRHAAYGASKAAAMHVCKVMAAELSGQGRDGQRHRARADRDRPQPITARRASKAISDRIPAGAYGTIADAVAGAALFLASDECEWTTGAIHNVDGGYGAAGLAYDPAEVGG